MIGVKSRLIAILLSVTLVFAYTPVIGSIGGADTGAGKQSVALADDSVGSDEGDTTEAIKEYIDALQKLTGKTEDVTKLAKVLEHLDGLSSIVSGSISLLEVMGVIEDPTSAMLSQILNEVIAVQDKLNDMDRELKDIISDLKKIEKELKEIQRNELAFGYQDRWDKFETNNLVALKKAVEEYQAIIDNAKEDWLKEQTHEGERVLYAKDKDGGLLQVYSKNSYDEGIPDKAETGEDIVKDECIGLPSKAMPKTSDIKYDPDEYTKKLTERTVTAFINAADNDSLEWSQKHKDEWAKLSDAEKKSMAEKYAPQIVESIIYDISCRGMSEKDSHKWAAGLKATLEEYCNVVVKVQYGLDALIQAYYNTHGLEGEIKDVLNKICDSVIAATGFYGTFVLGCLGQDNKYSKERDLKPLEKTWAGTMNKLSAMKKNAFTGHDNFCYVTNSLLDFEQLSLKSEMTVEYVIGVFWLFKDPKRYTGFDDTPWKLIGSDGKEKNPSVMGDVDAAVLYHLFQQQSNIKEAPDTFAKYLNKYNAGIPKDYKDKIMTNYHGAIPFALSDGIKMKAQKVIGDYFKTGGEYAIYTGKGKDCIDLHEKVVYDYIDAKNGATKENDVLAARAIYGQSKKIWVVDEAHMFYKCAGMKYDDSDRTTYWDGSKGVKAKANLSTPVSVIKMSKPGDAAGNVSGPSPLSTFSMDYTEKNADTAGVKDSGKDTETKKGSAKADWTKNNVDNLDLYEKNDKKFESGIRNAVTNIAANTRIGGKSVKLTDKGKKDIERKAGAMVSDMSRELENNNIVKSKDVFGIGKDDKAKKALAEKVLPSCYLTKNGKCDIPAENIETMAEYEPMFMLKYEKKKDEVEGVIEPAFDIHPLLVIWDPALKQFKSFDISDKVMKKMKLTMNVRIPVSFAEDNNVKVIHYSDYGVKKVLDKAEKKIKGSGNNKYVDMNVSSCSLFEIKGSGADKTADAVSTGDVVNLTVLIIMMVMSLGVMAAAAMRRRA